MAKKNNKKNGNNKPEVKKEYKAPIFSPKLIGTIADEVAKTVMSRLPHIQVPKRKVKEKSRTNKFENAFYLDTSAIIDGRIFEVIDLGLLNGTVVILESILLELKHIADSQDTVKRERGRKGLDMLESLKKNKKVKVEVLPDIELRRMTGREIKEVDERLIAGAKKNKGRIITCDYNLEKKGIIQGILAININALANSLKVRAVPGESLHIKVLHQGKDLTQGVGYLDDGTMIVIENASSNVGESLDVVVARVIQTSAGRILFAKKI
ncbi:MAG: hypothetical protein M1450_04575 [Patescibacteria group bacterium]|nr:hypothetical protein [Patescibacteria group bacterium]